MTKAWAAKSAREPLVPYDIQWGELKPDEIEIEVEHCGICHSDLSVLNNEWGGSQYPLVPGHEIIGKIKTLGHHVQHLSIGQRVGIGWYCRSCLHCHPCISGNAHLCQESKATIMGHTGGFSERVRAQANWAIPIPEGLNPSLSAPLLCAGTTVFAPFLIHSISPVAKVAVIGIGGLGHLALQFAKAWGCDVTALTSSTSKEKEAKLFGAHQVVFIEDHQKISQLKGKFDLILVTVNVSLDWPALIDMLAVNGIFHVVGAILTPIPIHAFQLITGQRKISGSPTGSPATMVTMLDFANRHQIYPKVERFSLNDVNKALEKLKSGQARYRLVLDCQSK